MYDHRPRDIEWTLAQISISMGKGFPPTLFLLLSVLWLLFFKKENIFTPSLYVRTTTVISVLLTSQLTFSKSSSTTVGRTKEQEDRVKAIHTGLFLFFYYHTAFTEYFLFIWT